MKRLLSSFWLTVSCALIASATFGQTAPQEMNYQGVARDAGGNVLANQSIGLRVELRQTTSTGSVVYEETHAATTNQFGLFNVKIGSGSVVLGTISAIDWSNGPYFVEVGMDATGGTAYVSMGVSQLLSVPYALYAETSGSAGPTGPAGADGPQGPTGPQGPAGADGTSVAIQGSVASSANLPASGNNNGDGYITEDTGRLWVWDGTQWVDVGLIQGPAGADGVTGPQGPQGPTGAQGPAGNDGSAGPIGPQGATGAQGPAGTNGATGVTGPTGPLVSGIENQTLRHNGSEWEASSTIWNSGVNVGIGNTNPTARLVVDGDIRIGYGDAFQLGGYDGLWYSASGGTVGNVIGSSNPSHNLTVGVGGSIQHIFSSEGNVGIRTTAPSARLEVVGDTLITGMFSSDYTGDVFEQPIVVYSEYNGESFTGAALYGKSVLANDGDGIGTVGEGGFIGVEGILDAGSSTLDCYAGYFGPSQMFGPLARAGGGGGGSTSRWGVYAEADGGTNNIGVQGVATDGGGDANYGVQATASDAIENYAVQAIAENGLGNFGLWASATGGLGNYAGYFDQGTVFVRDNVGIGTTNPQTELHIEHAQGVPSGLTLENTSTNNFWSFYVSFSTDVLRLYYNGSARGSFDEVSGNYSSTSDESLKQNISNLESGVLSKIMQMRPATYQYKSDADGKQYIGFIAQELKEIFPSVVTVLEEDGGNEDGVHLVSYSEIIPVLTKGMQEQQELIETQQAQISALESKVDELETLKAEIEKIKSALDTK